MKPLADKEYLLEKFPGKGGWTYARIPEIAQDKHNHFGWVKVKGSIDGHEIKQYNLMPMGNGNLFLPVKAEIRKKIKKEAGQKVRVILYKDEDAPEIPAEFRLCLEDEPRAFKFFGTLSDSEQNHYIQHIYSAKKEETRALRMAQAINRLSQGLKRYDRIAD